MSPATATFDAQSYRLYVRRFRGEFITVGLLGGLYGVLTVLSMISTYALTRRSGRIQPTAIILCLTIFTLFISTTTYLVTCILYYQSDFLDSFLSAPDLLWPGTALVNSVPDDLIQEYTSGLSMAAGRQACASAATLTINVILGDAVVCWRACVVWRRNHLVKAICGVFLLATFTYKAWESRRRLRGYLVAKVGGSQVEKFFVLLIESGAIYSAIWVVVVAYQFAQYKYTNTFTSISTAETGFIDTFGAIMSGVLVPIIAIYPAFIIVLVALNKSHVENGMTQNSLSVPTSQRQAVTLSTIVNTGHTQSRSSRVRDVLVIDGQDTAGGIGGTRADTNDSEEWKAETYRLADYRKSEEVLLMGRA